MQTKESRAEAIRAKALALGFDAVGFLEAAPDTRLARDLDRFLAEGRHGDMAWLEKHASRRADPKRLWPDAASVIVLGMNYAPREDPLSLLENPRAGAVSVYAKGADYHDVIKKRLKQLAGWVAQSFACEVKVFVDTAPVMEKPLARQGGLGWQGKHTNLVSTRFGSWLFLGEILTTLPLPADRPEADHCGTCRACLDVCPTQAFPRPHEIDARRCISYLTIEHKGVIPAEFRPRMGNRIYGCDDCLAVCPWNKFAQQTQELAFLPRAALTAPLLTELAGLDDAAFRRFFVKSPIRRIGRHRFLRNVLIGLGNSGDTGALPAVERRLSDTSAVVRGMAVWALKRLAEAGRFAKLRERDAASEKDPAVREEWAA